MKNIKITVLVLSLLVGAVSAQDRQSPPLEKLEITQAEWLDIEGARDKLVDFGKRKEAQITLRRIQ